MSGTLDSFESPFLTFTNTAVDNNYMGEIAELEALNRRTEAMDKAIREGREFDVLLDMLEEDGQDPNEYVRDVEYRLNQIYTYQLIPEDLSYWQFVNK